jgi:hypothetical protein
LASGVLEVPQAAARRCAALLLSSSISVAPSRLRAWTAMTIS